MTRPLSILLTIFFCFLITPSSPAANPSDELPLPGPTGSVRGLVITRDGKPAPFVSISLKAHGKGTTADESGLFQLRGLPAGLHMLTASFVGLSDQEQTVSVVAGQVTLVSFMLSEDARQLAEVQVKGYKSDNQKPLSLGKVAIRPLDLPQAVAVIDREVLERQQTLRLSDALMNVNGVYVMSNTGGTQEEIAGRGFAFGSSNTFKNGSRFNNAAMPELSSLERVEILKGSAAILFGNVGAGGILNLITKKPRFESGGSVSMRVGSFNFYKPAFDVYGGIGSAGNVAYRLNGTYENSRSFRDVVNGERIYVNPSLLFKVSDRTELLVEGDYLRDRRTPDYGIGAINYSIPDLPRNRFLGVSWSYNNIDQQSATATLTYQLSSNWQIRGMASGQDYRSDLFANQRPNGNSQPIRPNGDWIRGLQRSRVDEQYYIGQIDLTGQLQTGRVGHTLLFGADTDRYRTNTTAYAPLNVYDTVNVFNPSKFRARQDVPTLTARTLTQAPIDRAGIYVQDLIAFSPKIKLLAGLRYSYQQTASTVQTLADGKTTSTTTFDDAVTPRVGLVYQPVPTMSFFASYANSFNTNTGIDVSGNALLPSFIDQYEAGWKNDLFGGRLSANVTVYQIKNSNLAQTSLANGNTNANIRELAGEVTSQGLEVDLKTKPINGFSLIGGYSYNETRYTASNIFIVGSLLRYNPNHTANASIYYAPPASGGAAFRWAKGLNVGLTAFYMGERQAGRSTRLTVTNDAFRLIPLSAYTQLDLSAGYSLPRFSVRAKLSNLLNELNYNAHDDNSINPIAPRMISATVAWKW
jgi:iron complex outermembrane recepter protein